MGFDIRLPLGAMFTLLGTVLTAFGWLGDPSIYRRSLGININLWWGLVVLVFGITLLLLAWCASAVARPAGERPNTRSAVEGAP